MAILLDDRLAWLSQISLAHLPHTVRNLRAKFMRHGVSIDLGEVINIKKIYFYLVNIM